MTTVAASIGRGEDIEFSMTEPKKVIFESLSVPLSGVSVSPVPVSVGFSLCASLQEQYRNVTIIKIDHFFIVFSFFYLKSIDFAMVVLRRQIKVQTSVK
jgi:hypothetical protein